MMIAFLVAALILHVHPTAGPALPLAVLQDAELQSVGVGDYWANGRNVVGFTYHTDLSVKEVAEICRKEQYFHEVSSRTNPDSLQFSRRINGVHQSVSVRRRETPFATSNFDRTERGVRIDRFTTISINERPLQDQWIPRWYRGAIAKEPPTPMIEVPFLKGVMTTGVSIDSFDNLMSSKGLMYPGDDAYVYSALVESSYEKLEEQLKAWASKNGYTKTPHYGSWFKPDTRLFEIELRGYYSPGRVMIQVVIYASDRKAEHPIARLKF